MLLLPENLFHHEVYSIQKMFIVVLRQTSGQPISFEGQGLPKFYPTY